MTEEKLSETVKKLKDLLDELASFSETAGASALVTLNDGTQFRLSGMGGASFDRPL